jgi:ABC-2 type transport system permease protein
VHAAPSNWLLYFGIITLVSVLFSALGLIFGLVADKFDHIAILTTFVITPLTFVGGVFTSAKMLPPALRNFELFNPIFYTIDAFRRSYTGQSDLAPAFSIGMVALLTAISLGIILRMTAIGYKLRT